MRPAKCPSSRARRWAAAASRQARFVMVLAIAYLAGCRTEPTAAEVNEEWTTFSHSDSTPPQFGVVFPTDSVPRLEITLDASQWVAVRANMVTLFGVDFGAGGSGPAPVLLEEPMYVDATVRFNGKRWDHVGFRLKGNSSLNAAWRQGNYKLPFRLNFDKFEDEFPGILDQRFFGFDELSFSPGFKDQSLIREKVTADILRLADIPAARTAFYRVYLDVGTGSRYVGVYTVVEVADDTFLKRAFPGQVGNLYKPESRLATFSIPQFEKKVDVTGSYADVQGLVSALNSPLRTTDRAAWRAGLEAVLDVPHFTKWLAINTAMVNWDTYGVIAHNYYLFRHPQRGFVWIPWDHNEALVGSPGISASVAPTVGSGLSLSLNEVTTAWPLIRHVADDPVYLPAYRAAMNAFVTQVFTPARMDSLFTRNHALVAPYAVGANGEQPGATYLTSAAAFTGSLETLKAHVRARQALVNSWIP